MSDSGRAETAVSDRAASVPPPPELRPRDLAAMVVPWGRALMRAEEPVLAAHGLPMWGYSVLLALRNRPARSQATLAAHIGADKTRLIPILDDLQAKGLIERHPDPADRRARLLAITPAGTDTATQIQTEIQRQEDELLAQLDPADRATLLRTLALLSKNPAP